MNFVPLIDEYCLTMNSESQFWFIVQGPRTEQMYTLTAEVWHFYLTRRRHPGRGENIYLVWQRNLDSPILLSRPSSLLVAEISAQRYPVIMVLNNSGNVWLLSHASWWLWPSQIAETIPLDIIHSIVATICNYRMSIKLFEQDSIYFFYIQSKCALTKALSHPNSCQNDASKLNP